MPELPREILLLLLLGAWVLLAVVQEPLLAGMKVFVEGIKTALQYGQQGLSAASTAVNAAVAPLQDHLRRFGQGAVQFLGPVVSGLSSLISMISTHWNATLAIVTKNNGAAVERGVGALIYMTAMVSFIYADAVLSLNAVTAVTQNAGIRPPEIPVFLGDVTAPIIIAFIGNVFMLSVILADLSGFTGLAPWPRNGRAHVIYRNMAAFNVMAVLGLAFLLMMARFVALNPALAPQGLATPTGQYLYGLANFAMNAITLPALITTFLLWPAVFALVFLWLILVSVFIAAVALARWLVSWLREIAPLVAGGAAVITEWLAALARAILGFLEWSLGLAGKALDALVKLVEWSLTTLTFLPRRLGHGIRGLFSVG